MELKYSLNIPITDCSKVENIWKHQLFLSLVMFDIVLWWSRGILHSD